MFRITTDVRVILVSPNWSLLTKRQIHKVVNSFLCRDRSEQRNADRRHHGEKCIAPSTPSGCDGYGSFVNGILSICQETVCHRPQTANDNAEHRLTKELFWLSNRNDDWAINNDDDNRKKIVALLLLLRHLNELEHVPHQSTSCEEDYRKSTCDCCFWGDLAMISSDTTGIVSESEEPESVYRKQMHACLLHRW